MADIDLKTATPDTSLPTTGFLFGADSQVASAPSVYSTQTVATTMLGSTSLTGATVTTSQPILDLAQTWNAGAVTFTGLKFNVTDIASAAASNLIDIGTGGGTYVSRFSVSKGGNLTVGGQINVVASNYNIIKGVQSGLNAITTVIAGIAELAVGQNTIIANSLSLGVASAGSFGSVDTSFRRDAAGVLGVRGSSTTTPAAMSFYTYGASPPASPAASIVRLYADTSGGKIRLMALFPSGVAQQIAIEP